MLPWWRSAMMRREMSSPRPVPRPISFVVKNGSNARACTSERHARPGIADLDHEHVGFGSGRDAQGPGALHGVDRVVDQVRPDLVELARDRLDAGQVGFVVAHHDDVVAQLVREHDQTCCRCPR